jgi:hypothetical protein
LNMTSDIFSEDGEYTLKNNPDINQEHYDPNVLVDYTSIYIRVYLANVGKYDSQKSF